jgi:hypothetical protein
MKHYNVIIATPGKNMESEYVTSLIDTIDFLNKNNISYKFVNKYSPTVSAAREGTIMDDYFLDIFNDKPLRGSATYDKIIWIDSDIAWTPEDFMKLYNSDKDLISGVYVSDRGVPMFSMNNEPSVSPIDAIKRTEVFEISQAGFGFIAIKSGVFESLSRPWFDTVFSKITNENGEERLVPYGEDYSFCIKATNAGFKIYLDPTVQVVHNKKVSLSVQH